MLFRSQQKARLNFIRAGIRTPDFDAKVSQSQPKDFFSIKDASNIKPVDIAFWDSVDLDIKRIANSEGLSVSEYEYFLTIPSPRGPSVFYPYHILSRDQARAMGWD